MSNKRVLIVVGLLVLIGAGATTYFFIAKNKSKSKTYQIKSQSNDIIQKDFPTYPIDTIQKKYAGKPDIIYEELMSAGFKKNGVKKYPEAIAYFQAASKATKKQEFKDEADISVYHSAKKAGDEKLKAEYEKLLGAKLNQLFKSKENAINPQ